MSMAVETLQQISNFMEKSFSALMKFLALLWTWSFGQVVAVFQSEWQSLPAWKIVLLVLVLVGIGILLWRATRDVWDALLATFRSFVDLVAAFVVVLPYIVGAGVLAFLGGWIIQKVTL